MIAPSEMPDDAAGRVFARWTRLLSGHRVMVSSILVLLGVAFAGLSKGITWQPDVLLFFSSNSEEVRNVRDLMDQAGPANHLRIDLHVEGEGADDSLVISAAASELADALRSSGKFRMVWTGVDGVEMTAAYAQCVSQAPLFLTDAERAAFMAGITPEHMRERFAEVRRRLIDPDGEILAQQLQGDPLGLSGIVTDRLASLSSNAGSQPALSYNGLVTARDAMGRLHALLLAEPRCFPSDLAASESMLTATQDAIAKVKAAHPDVAVWAIGAHRGYVENAQRAKADVTRVSLFGSLAVAAAIAIYFRRLSTALLCIIPPSIGVGLALGIAGMMHLQLPLILLGFTGLLCGSTTDYGIQIISECRRFCARHDNQWDADIPAVAARRLLGPITMSMVTSVTGYAALGLSDAPGLAALGLFVAAATVCIWAVTFLVFPAYLGPWILPRHRAAVPEVSPTRRARGLVGGALFVLCTAWLAVAALHVGWIADLHALDGSSPAMLAEEDSFFRVWGEMRNQAIILVNRPTADEAMAEMQRVNDFLIDQQRDGLIAGVVSAASVLPDQRTADERSAAWRSFWTDQRRRKLQETLYSAASENGFTTESFAAYADHIGDITAAPADERLKTSPAALLPGFIDFVGDRRQGQEGGVSLAAIVRMRADQPTRLTTGWSQELRLRFPGATVLSGHLLVFDATDRARAEGARFALPCLLAILFPLWIYFRRLAAAWLAMTCLGVGMLWVLGIAAVFGGGLNLLALLPVLFTLGVAVDYGIYAATDPAWRENGALAGYGNRQGATFLCALTTILGSGSLVLASHPALKWLGMTLVAGITGGYLTSIFIVAPLTRWQYRSRSSKTSSTGGRIARRAIALIPRLALLALTFLLMFATVLPMVIAHEQPNFASPPGRPPIIQQIGQRTFAAGASWLRWRETSADSGLWEMMITGPPFERGQAMAALGAPIDMRIENEMLDQFDGLVKSPISRWLLLQAINANFISLPGYVPEEYQLEIYGQSCFVGDPHAYLSPAYPRILGYHALHDVSQKLIDNPLIAENASGCTGVISLPSYSAKDSGHLMLARNFDFEGGESFGRQKSITYVVPTEGIPFAHVAWPGLSGAVTGMNREKIAVFINAAATGDHRRIGTPTILMAREILQYARSIEDADRIVRRTQVFVSDILVVADGKTGQVRVFEKSPDRAAAFEVDGSAVVTNHLVTPAFANDVVNQARIAEGTTLQRCARARQLLDRMQHQVTVESLANLLRDKKGLDGQEIGYGNRNAIDGLIACHAVIMDVTAGQLWVAAWPNAEGAFIGVDVMSMLDHAGGNPGVQAPASPPDIPPDNIMTSGQWQRILAARISARDAQETLQRGDTQAARKSAEVVIEMNPNGYLGHELLGRALLNAGDHQGARAAFVESLRLDPPYATRRKALTELIRQCDSH